MRALADNLQVKDALATTGEVVPAGQGDGQVPEAMPALRDSGITGYKSLEPHLATAGQFGGFGGPDSSRRAAQALKALLSELSVPWQ
jgi:sugar phosphate isomerase/epimerase